MSAKETADPKLQERVARLEKRDNRIAHIYRRALHLLEQIIATVSILALVAALCIEIFRMVTVEGYFNDIGTYLTEGILNSTTASNSNKSEILMF